MKPAIVVGAILMSLSVFIMAQSNERIMKTEKIKIEIWSDVVCPFCYVGKKKMELAISTLKAEDQVEIVWRSFQLDPDFPLDKSISTNEYLVERKGYPKEQVDMMTSQLVQNGKKYGIDFKFDKARSFNTESAHQLIHWAKGNQKASDLKEALMYHYFTEGLDLSVRANLLKVVKSVGLDEAGAIEALDSAIYASEVEKDITKAQLLGVSGVPYFLINGELSISGAQDDKVFEEVITRVLKK